MDEKGGFSLFLLKLAQYDVSHDVGLFETEEDIYSWLNKIESIEFHNDYRIQYSNLKPYEEIRWNDSIFILSKYMFSEDDGDIYADWYEIKILSEVDGLVDGQTKVSSYVVNNDEVKRYIDDLEALQQFLIKHFEKDQAQICGQGSEDGLYLLVNDEFICHLEGEVLNQWQQKSSEQQFIDQFLS